MTEGTYLRFEGIHSRLLRMCLELAGLRLGEPRIGIVFEITCSFLLYHARNVISICV